MYADLIILTLIQAVTTETPAVYWASILSSFHRLAPVFKFTLICPLYGKGNGQLERLANLHNLYVAKLGY